MAIENSDEEFLMYVWSHSETERALFSRDHVLRLLKLANVPEDEYPVPRGSFISVRYDIAKPLVDRARRQLKRQGPQIELPFKGARGSEDYLL